MTIPQLYNEGNTFHLDLQKMATFNDLPLTALVLICQILNEATAIYGFRTISATASHAVTQFASKIFAEHAKHRKRLTCHTCVNYIRTRVVYTDTLHFMATLSSFKKVLFKDCICTETNGLKRHNDEFLSRLRTTIHIGYAMKNRWTRRTLRKKASFLYLAQKVHIEVESCVNCYNFSTYRGKTFVTTTCTCIRKRSTIRFH